MRAPLGKVVGGDTRNPIEGMRRRLTTHRDRLAALLTGLSSGTASHEELHEGHREMRRLRSDAGLWVRIAPTGRAAGFSETDESLRRLARDVGRVRNFDVGRELIRDLSRGPHPALRPGDRRLLDSQLSRAARDGRAALARDAGEPRATQMLTAVDRPLRAALPRAAIDRLAAVVEDELELRIARLERALARAYARPTVARLHRLRITLRGVRTVGAVRHGLFGRAALPVSPTLLKLQVDLGRLHDVDLLREFAQSHLKGETRDRVDSALARERRLWKKRLVRRLGRRPLRREWEALVRGPPD